MKEIITELIKQDLMYNQYIAALKKFGIEIYDFEVDLVSVITKLMGQNDCCDAWVELYAGYLTRCGNYEIVPSGRNLYPLAEECYEALKNFDPDASK